MLSLAQEGCALAPTTAFPSPASFLDSLKAKHTDPVYIRASELQSLHYLTMVLAIGMENRWHYNKIHKIYQIGFFFQGWLQAQVDNQKIFTETGNSVCSVEISLNLQNITVPYHPLAEYFGHRDLCYTKS